MVTVKYKIPKGQLSDSSLYEITDIQKVIAAYYQASQATPEKEETVIIIGMIGEIEIYPSKNFDKSKVTIPVDYL